jgi:hypothetical protein
MKRKMKVVGTSDDHDLDGHFIFSLEGESHSTSHQRTMHSTVEAILPGLQPLANLLV